MVTRTAQRRPGLGSDLASQELRRGLSSYAPGLQALEATETLRADWGEKRLVRLWDTVDGNWSSYIPDYQVAAMQLHEVVFRCTTCPWTAPSAAEDTARQQYFRQHMEQENRARQQHTDASLLPIQNGYGQAFRCSGCGATFDRPGRFEIHISGILRKPVSHSNATLLAVRRFTLEPPVSGQGPADQGTANGAQPISAASQMDWRQVPAKRRRRHRHRGSGHGNNG